jgi:PhoH-like ATPase
MSTVNTALISTNGKNGKVKKSRSKTTEKVHYVIDLSALLKNPRCLFQYQDGDIYIPEHVIIGLDKKTSSRDVSVSFAVEAVDLIRRIISNADNNVADGFPLSGPSNGVATGKLYLRDTGKINHSFGTYKNPY